MARVIVKHDFELPPSRVFAYLAEHEHLAAIFGAKVKRIKDGETDRNGVGSVRELQIGPLPPFQETVTEFDQDRLIRYRITKGSPLKDHEGVMHFSPKGSGTHLRYEISFGAVVPGLAALIAAGLRRNVARGMRSVDRAA